MTSQIRIGNKWEPFLDLPNKGYGYAMVPIRNNQIAVVGGYKNGETQDSVDLYNLETGQWSSFKMKERRNYCAAVAIDNELFIFGGWNGLKRLSSCEMYDLNDQSRKSHFIPPMSQPKAGSAAVVHDGTNVVLLGGCSDDGQRLETAGMFDTISKKWIELPSMPTPRSNFAIGISGSNVIAAGGFGDSGPLDTVEIFDMQKRTWKKAADMNKKQSHLGGVIIGESTKSFHMVVAGGFAYGGNTSQSCEVYSFKDDSWSSLPDLKSLSDIFRQLIIMDGMLIAGGETNLEILDLSTPGLVHRLVHFAMEHNLI